MPPILTQDDRGAPASSRGVASGRPAAEDRGLVRGHDDWQPVPAPAPPHGSRAGPLMTMVRAVEREQRLAEAAAREQTFDRLEKAMREREERFLAITGTREASVRGGAASRVVHRAHRQKLASGKKEGVAFGVEWLAEQSEKRGKNGADWARKERKALEARGLTMASCLTMMDVSLPEYTKGLGSGSLSAPDKAALEARLRRALANAADAQGTGAQRVFGGRATVALEELRKGFGFETVHIDAVRGKEYWNAKNYTSDAGTRASGVVPNQANLVTGADSGRPIDVKVHIDRFVKLGAKPTAASRELFESLKQVEYAVGVADSGYHVFALAGGMVYEVHWTKGPGDKKLTSAVPLEKFFKTWGSGVIAVPPATLKPPAAAAPRPRR